MLNPSWVASQPCNIKSFLKISLPGWLQHLWAKLLIKHKDFNFGIWIFYFQKFDKEYVFI